MLLLSRSCSLHFSLSLTRSSLSLSFSFSLSLSLSPSLSLSVYFPQTGSPSRERVVRECNHRGANAEYQRGSHCRLGGAEEVQRVRRMIEWLQTVEVGVSRLTMGEWTAVCLVRPVNRSLKTVVITSGVICLESDDMPSLYYAVTPLLPIHPLFSLSPWFLGSFFAGTQCVSPAETVARRGRIQRRLSQHARRDATLNLNAPVVTSTRM